MKKILVTGGSGFIGKNILASYLNDRYELYAPTRAELDCSDDESVKNYFKYHYFDVVIHAAIKPTHRNAVDFSDLLYTNLRMAFNLLKYQDRWGKLLNMGSGSIYDMRYYQPKMRESYFGVNIPADELGFYKYILGKQLSQSENVYDFRLFGIFGKNEDYSIRFISNVICKVIFDLPVTLRQNRKFDYLYVDDLMPVLEYFIENNPKEKAYNITPDNSIELLEIANIVKGISGKHVEIEVGEPGYGLPYSGDNSLLKSEMKNIRFTPIETSIGYLYGWYEQNKGILNKKLILKDK